MKKFLVLMLVLALLLPASAVSFPGKGHPDLWHHNTPQNRQDVHQQGHARFNEEYPNVTVEVSL